MPSGTIDHNFRPAWWLPEGHTQTLWRKFSPPQAIAQRRQRLELADGDFIDIDWAAQIDPQDSANSMIVVIQHGLCGCSRSPYVIALQSLLVSHGIASVAINFRSCSGEVNRLAKAYHSGISEDTGEVFDQLSQQYPNHQFAFVGYSLGANVLLKWLGEIQQHAQIHKAVAVSTPFSLEYCSRAMLKGISRVYGSYFVRSLMQSLRQKQQFLQRAGNQEQLRQLQKLGSFQGIRTIWDFDDRITAPLHGFKDAADYYQQCSSQRFLQSIGVNTLLIQSSNDPMIPAAALPDPRQLPLNIELLLQNHGGHVGFISGGQNNWLERRIVGFIIEQV